MASRILDEVDRLAEDPVGLSRPTHFPYRPGQCYEFQAEHEGRDHFLTVFFRYGADEGTLYVTGIGCIPQPDAPEA